MLRLHPDGTTVRPHSLIIFPCIAAGVVYISRIPPHLVRLFPVHTVRQCKMPRYTSVLAASGAMIAMQQAALPQRSNL